MTHSILLSRLTCGLAMAAFLVIGGTHSALGQSKPEAFTHPVRIVQPVDATFSGRVTPNLLPTTAWFEWGTNASFTATTALVEVGADWGGTNITATVSNLLMGEVCQVRLVCSNALGVSVGLSQRFAVRGAAWGWGTFGQRYLHTFGYAAMFRDWNHVIAIAAGSYHTLTLDYEGQAYVHGTFRSPTGWDPSFVPAGVSNVVAIGSGWNHCLAVTEDRHVIAWGGSGANAGQTNVPAGLSNVVAVAGGEFHSLALRADGSVAAWGSNLNAQVTIPAGLSNVVAIAAGARHNLALRNDGTVVAWGDNLSGKATVPQGLSNVVAVAAGANHSMALKADGTVRLWGSNSSQQSTLPAGVSNVVAIAAGPDNSLALTVDGAVVVWGHSYFSITGTYTNAGNVVGMACGPIHAVILRASGPTPPRAAIPSVNRISASSARMEAFVAPNGTASTAWFEWGALGNGYPHVTLPVNVGDGMGLVRVKADIAGLVDGGRYQCRLVVSNEVARSISWERRFTTGSKLTAWGYDYAGQGSTRVPPGLTNAVAMDGSRGHVIVIKNDGKLIAWGLNDQGQTVVPAGLTNVLDVSASGWHSLALKADGTVAAWGLNLAGQTDVPTGLSNVVQVAAGGWHSAALLEDGTVVVWGGRPLIGQPQLQLRLGGLSNVTAIATSGDHILAMRSDGMTFAWGEDGLINQNYVPGSLSMLDVVAFSAGIMHNLFLLRDGSAVRWGGYATGVPPQIAPPPADLTNAVAVAAGWFHSLALRSDGTVTSWMPAGFPYYGQTNVPPGLSDVVAIAAGEDFSLALGSDVPYIIAPGTFNGYVNKDLVIPLPAMDPNGDLITFRIATLPGAGALYQYVAGARGDPITAPDTAVADSQGRVIFAPGLDGFGSPYATFSFLVNDGVADSSPATVTVNLSVPAAPQFVTGGSGWSTNTPGAFELRFTGNTNAAYSAYGSSNLIHWERLGWATKTSNSVFQFLDTTATNWPQRFYRVGAP